MANPQQCQPPHGSIKPSNIIVYYWSFSFFAKTTMTIIFFSMLVVKYKEGKIAITNYDLLFELAKFYNYEGFS
jgi:hypothetical protein